MTTNRFLLVVVGISSISHCVQAQQDCAQSLIQAERAYYTGRFAEIEAILGECIRDGFDKEQKVEAYKLLALGSIFSRNDGTADSALYSMLKINPQFTPEPEDPQELKNRLEKFNARPLASVTIGSGAYLPIIRVKEVYNLRGGTSEVTYETSIGYQAGLGAAFYLNKKIVFESSFEAQSVAFNVTKINKYTEIRMDEKQRRRELVIAGGYNVKWGGVYCQLLIGAAVNSLKSAQTDLYKVEKAVDRSGDIIEDEFVYRKELNFSNLDHRSRTDVRPLAITRISLAQKNGYLISFSLRYEYSSQEFAANRYSDIGQIVRFDWIEDEYKANYFSVGLSVSKLFYYVRR